MNKKPGRNQIYNRVNTLTRSLHPQKAHKWQANKKPLHFRFKPPCRYYFNSFSMFTVFTLEKSMFVHCASHLQRGHYQVELFVIKFECPPVHSFSHMSSLYILFPLRWGGGGSGSSLVSLHMLFIDFKGAHWVGVGRECEKVGS